ncbi:MAG: DUF11 domain-containing protein [Pirellulales bacterium]|nr:DUF11 domain-containing protein [Pirellulales bacterium]
MPARAGILATLVALTVFGGVVHGQENKDKGPSFTERFDRFRRNLFGGGAEQRSAAPAQRSRNPNQGSERITGVPEWPGQSTSSRGGPARGSGSRMTQQPRTGAPRPDAARNARMPSDEGALGSTGMPSPSASPNTSSRRTAQPGYERQALPPNATPIAAGPRPEDIAPRQPAPTAAPTEVLADRPPVRDDEAPRMAERSQPPAAEPLSAEPLAVAPSRLDEIMPEQTLPEATPAGAPTHSAQPTRRASTLGQRLASARRAGSSRLLSGEGAAAEGAETESSTSDSESAAPTNEAPPNSEAIKTDSPESGSAGDDAVSAENPATEAAPAHESDAPATTTPSGDHQRHTPSSSARASSNQGNRSRRSSGRSSPAVQQPVSDSSEASAESSSASSEADSSDTTSATESSPATTPEVDSTVTGEPDVLVTRQSPVISVDTVGPRKIKVGMPAAYRIVVKNAGSLAAEGLLVTVRVPEGADLVGTQAGIGSVRPAKSADQGAGVEWVIDSLGARSETSLTLRLVPLRSRPIELGVEWSLSPVAVNTLVEVQEPKLLMSLVGPEEVYYGKRESYKLTLTNPGTGDAEHVVVSLLPTTPGEDQAVIHEVGTLRAGGSKVVELELTARQHGTLRLRAEATADGSLSTAVDEEVLVRRAELRVEVDGPQLLYAGTAGTYTIHVSNPGNAAAQNVKLTSMLPADAKYVSGSDGATLSDEGNRVAWSTASLRPGAEWIVSFRCELTAAGAATTQLVATADEEVESGTTFATEVEALADLSLEIKDPAGPVPVGQEATYEIHIHNRGTKSAAGIGVVAFFSRGIEPMQIEGGKHHVGPGRITFAPLRSIGAGQEIVLTIKAQANEAGNHLFRAEVECEELETKLSAEETTRFYGDGPAAPHASRRKQPVERRAAETGEAADRGAREPAEESGSFWPAADGQASAGAADGGNASPADTLVPDETTP